MHIEHIYLYCKMFVNKTMGETKYLYLCSDSSSTQLRYINSNEIVIELSSPLELIGEWECSLIELHLKLKSAYKYGEYFDVLSDIVEGTITNIGCQSLLRRVISDHTGVERIHYTDLPPRFLRVKLINLQRVSFRILEYADKPKIDIKQPIYFVLVFRKRKNE